MTEILTKAGEMGVSKIKDNLIKSGESTTGKTANSLRFEATATSLTIYGRPFFKATETGSKPSNKNPSPEMVQSLTEWAKAKGAEGKPYAIAKSILKHGSKLWQQGGRKDIFSNVEDELVDYIGQEAIKSLWPSR